MSANAIWTPDGIRKIDAKAAERIELMPGQLERLIQFGDVAAAFELGIHCTLCSADLVGKNATSDRVYSVSCGCRDFMGNAPAVVYVVRDVMSWMKPFEEMAKSLKLQMHCSRCSFDMKQAVASDDRAYSVACPCRELKPRVGGNRVSPVQ